MNIKTRILPLAVLASCMGAHASDIEITSLTSNGRLSWTNAPTNGLFTVQWASALSTNTDWRGDWNALQGFWVSGPTSTVEVPMFYRVKCSTNLFAPYPVGGQFTFSVSNAIGNVWTQQISILGYGKSLAGAGKDYTVMEIVESGRMSLQLFYSTDSAAFNLDQYTLADVLSWQRASVGTPWTNYNYKGQWTRKVTVEAIESVSTKAGTFDSCYKFHKQALNSSNPTPDYYEWVKPGFGLVKSVDYWVDASEHPPIVYELQSWSASSH
jgi:hypothetical protein